MTHHSSRIEGPAGLLLAVLVAALAWPASVDAQVRKIVIEKKVSPAFDGRSFGNAGPYETLAGRAFGELDPNDRRNAVITDIQLAPRNARGMVEYVASFYLVKPIDMSRASKLIWHDVPNRGGRLTIGVAEREAGDVGLSSGWQGDNSGRTVPGPENDYVVVPVARNADGSPVTGLVLGRVVNASGPDSRPLLLNGNPVPYKPVSLDTTKATLMAVASETIDGKVEQKKVPETEWAWAKCSAAAPFPGTPDPTQICLKNGFDPALAYRITFTAQDPYVLGIGFAAFRDVASFFKNATQDAEGTPNPLAGQVTWTISRGRSQSGNFLRAFLHFGFNEDTAGRKVHDGAWPIIAGGLISLNARFAMPDGTSKLYEAGREGPVWWEPSPDPVRGLPAKGVLSRCMASNTCPKIIEHMGAAEVWGLVLTPAWIGTKGDTDLPVPSNVRRYYIGSTQHGGGDGGFSVVPAKPPMCPGGANFGQGVFPANPMPHTETINALRVHFRNWVMKDTPPPPSRWPTLKDKFLVAPTKEAMGFPSIPGVPATAPTGLMTPLLDYDWGPQFKYDDASGVLTKVPPTIKRVITGKVPRVDADGNELGGVPVVLRDAPLGTYLGWNITAGGFHKGKICGYAGSMIPFARTRAERMANNDPRLSLEERYTNHDGYVAAVKTAAARAVKEGFLLENDAEKLIAEAAKSDVLKAQAVDSRQ
jgi:hypothetical protein